MNNTTGFNRKPMPAECLWNAIRKGLHTGNKKGTTPNALAGSCCTYFETNIPTVSSTRQQNAWKLIIGARACHLGQSTFDPDNSPCRHEQGG